jgi:uncharacterized membrane protein YdbT with pleckstrin-like domain
MPPQNPLQPGQSGQPDQTPPLEPVVNNPLAVMQPDEKVIFELKRHPIGILITYLATAVILIVVAVLAFGLAPGLAEGAQQQRVKTAADAVFVVFALLSLVFNIIATIIYWGNKWILTTDSITQINQTGLFRKESSQLGLESIEDVTASQNGILPKLFNYGVLTVETAGHHGKFTFQYAPKPVKYAQRTLEAREETDKERMHYGAQENNPPAAGGPPQPPNPTYS